MGRGEVGKARAEDNSEWECLACDPPDAAKASRERAEETDKHLHIPWSLQRRPARHGIYNPRLFNVLGLCICEVQSQLGFLGQEQHLAAGTNTKQRQADTWRLISSGIWMDVEE